MKRIALLILTNIAIVVMLGIVLNVVSLLTGINFGQMAGKSLNITSLLVFAFVVGFAGSIISLLMSKSMAKMSMGVQMIDTDNPQPGLETWLVGVIRQLSDKAGIKMPEVGIYEGEPNAFATGATKNSSMVCVSTGLLRLMNQKEVEAVLGHEISHAANGDMVTMTLVQGVMNTRLSEHIGTMETNAFVQCVAAVLSLLVLVFWRTGSFAALGAAPKYCWFGGVLALAITVTVMLGMGRLGPTLAVATILIAQLATAAAIDAFGIMGTEKLAFGWSKWAGLALMTGGVLLFKMK